MAEKVRIDGLVGTTLTDEVNLVELLGFDLARSVTSALDGSRGELIEIEAVVSGFGAKVRRLRVARVDLEQTV